MATARRKCGASNAHAPPCALVGRAVAVVPHDRDAGIACGRLVERHLQGVDVSLRCGPLLVELRLAIFLERDEIQERRDVADLRLDRGRNNRRIDPGVFLDIGLGVFGIVVPGEIEVRGLLRDVVGLQCRCDANDKVAGLLQDSHPSSRIERGVIDVADQVRHASGFVHCGSGLCACGGAARSIGRYYARDFSSKHHPIEGGRAGPKVLPKIQAAAASQKIHGPSVVWMMRIPCRETHGRVSQGSAPMLSEFEAAVLTRLKATGGGRRI